MSSIKVDPYCQYCHTPLLRESPIAGDMCHQCWYYPCCRWRGLSVV